MESETSTVRVGVRIRPKTPNEIVDGCQTCTTVTPGEPQVWIGGNHAFTYDYVFDTNTSQDSIFQNVKCLVDGCLQGYNATIIAYGQTGSGKTYTMGTGLNMQLINSNEISETQGIVPRALNYLFSEIDAKIEHATMKKISIPEFRIRAQFIEIYNEEVIDLITSTNSKTNLNRPGGGNGDNDSFSSNRLILNQRRPSNHSNVGIKIHEDQSGGIYLVGVGTTVVTTIDDALQCLRNGVLCRTTASTNMNDKSSRSHAVYTIYLEQRRLMDEELIENNEEYEILSAKFHFVDLAGSERLKRTGAVGERAKEGISINCGLLSLGNVISALGDKSKKAAHIPYRDSKLTRLLQDSLGGNSKTVMIACVSPCDQDFVETLNTLKYANRARNIKNKVQINQNKSSRTIAMLRQEISLLQMELYEAKQGKIGGITETAEQDNLQEIVWIKAENEFLHNRIIAMQETIEQLTCTNSQLLAEKAASNLPAAGSDLSKIIQKYTLDIEDLRGRLFESEATCQLLKRKNFQYQTIIQAKNSPHENASSFQQQPSAQHEIVRPRKIERRQNDECKSNTPHIEADPEMEYEGEDEQEDSSCIETQDQLVSINEQIITKERLIEQLELSNRRALDTKQHYEEQIKVLSAQIRKTEDERDSLVSSTNSSPQNSPHPPKSGNLQSRNIIQLREYENKLKLLQNEMKRMQDATREHDKLVRKNAAKEKQLYSLKQEVELMKRLKVKLMNQLKEENIKWRANESKRLREIAQLKKDQRKKENAIRTLESRGQLNEQLLKRRQEEIKMLRKLSKPNLSRRAAGKVGSNIELFHNAKKQWVELRSEMIRQASMRLTLDALELDLVDALSERTRIKDEISKLNIIKGRLAIGDGQVQESSSNEINQFNDDLDTFNASLIYCEEKINEIQSSIMELNSSSPNGNKNSNIQIGGEIKPYIEVLNREECCYILQKMYEDSLENLSSSKRNSNRLSVLQQENELLSLKVTALQEYIRKRGFNSELPAYLKPNPFKSPRKVLPPLVTLRREQIMARSVSGSISARPKLQGNPLSPKPPQTEKEKHVRSIGKPQELLGRILSQRQWVIGNRESESPRLPPKNMAELRCPELFGDQNNNCIKAKPEVLTSSPRPILKSEILQPLSEPREAIAKDVINELSVQTLIDFGKQNNSEGPESTENDRMNISVPTNRIDKIPETDSIEDETRFNKLPSKPYKIYFQHTHSAEGHSKPVISMFSTEDRLFTGSKDSTAKSWDLASGKELSTISGFPVGVSCIKYDAELGLIFTVSSYFIKAHDLRTGSCVRTMTSAGTSFAEDVMFYPNMRMLQVPYGEITINSIAISSQKNSFYTTFNEKVRLWDLRTFSSVGLLSGRHQAQVMCMTSDYSEGHDLLITGSKDHHIKLYDLDASELKGNLNIPPKCTLNPSHEDGIESLVISNGMLFSGSRDCCIKKWDMNQKDHKLSQSIKNAHSGWITGLAFSPSNTKNLLSSSRDGLVKVWDIEQCEEIGRMGNLEGGINCISANSSLVFTGSGEDTVGFWKMLESAE